MKKFIVSLFLFGLMIPVLSSAQNPNEKLNVVSYNIRYDNPSDGENKWANRKDYAADFFKFYEVDVCGAQEVLHNQLTDLLERLPDYGYIGVGREDGKTKGEYAPIFYRKDRFSVVESGNFWLAEDMDAVGKKGWDAACERVATWGIFKNKVTGKEFFMLNTHLDHVGKVARHEGASLVLEQAGKLSKGLPVIITGDFNATVDSDPVQVLVNKKDPRHVVDTRPVAEVRYGPEWTFHNFGRIPVERRNLIDYIFIKGSIKVIRHGVLADTKNELYLSDHCPILSTLVLP